MPHLHNSYVQLAAERGLPALAAYLATPRLRGAARAWRGFRRERGARHARADLHLGVLAALAAFSIAGLFENNWGDTEVQRMVALPARGAVLPRADRRGGRRAGRSRPG